MSSGPIEVKVCIIGDTDVGKTSLSTRYCHGEFPENSTPTIGASFLQRRVILDNAEISLQIWDTAGQERCEFKEAIASFVDYLLNLSWFLGFAPWLPCTIAGRRLRFVCST